MQNIPNILQSYLVGRCNGSFDDGLYRIRTTLLKILICSSARKDQIEAQETFIDRRPRARQDADSIELSGKKQ